MTLKGLLAAIALGLAPYSLSAATLEIEASESMLQLQPAGTGSTTLQLKTADESISLIAWQLALTVVPEIGATGTVTIHAYAKPANYVFEGFDNFGIGPAFNSEIPGVSPILTDALVAFPPLPVIAASAAANLVALEFKASADAQGVFRISMPPLNDDFSDSYWVSADTFLSAPFGNNVANAVVLTVLVQQTPEPSGRAQLLLAAGLFFCIVDRRP